MGEARVCPFRERRGHEAAIVFIHGFSGDSQLTWGQFPELVCQEKALENWDVFSVGYNTSLWFDIASIWAADPPLDRLAGYFRTRMGLAPFNQYQALALAAHSMGGLVVQSALADDKALAARTSHLLLYGTPSAGLGKASIFARLKRSVRDMGAKSKFILDLRRRWKKRFSQRPPFTFLAVAGDRDEFVPPHSSLYPFPPSCQRVIAGNHLEIVKPQNASHMGYQLLLSALTATSPGDIPLDSAKLALESRQFEQVIEMLSPGGAALDKNALGQLALALDATGRREEAIRLLSECGDRTTDVMGILAGRLKRRWLLKHVARDAEEALSLYGQGYQGAVAALDPCQAFYHGINIAFLELACHGAGNGPARVKAREWAETVLGHCDQARRAGLENFWLPATEGEALLLLNRPGEALEHYQAALQWDPPPSPREINSMYQQATQVCWLCGNRETGRKLQEIFAEGGRKPNHD